MNATKARILDAAEKLVAEHGLNVSLRTITAEAGVNLAAVNYHFQSKDALWESLVERRFAPLNARRLELLDQVEAAHPEGILPLEPVLDAFLTPLLTMSADDAEHFRPLIGRLFTLPEEFLLKMFGKHILPIVSRFDPAFARALPHLSDEERRWRMAYTAGSMIHVLNWGRIMKNVAPGSTYPSDTGMLTRSIIAFAAGGFRAPAAERGLHA